VASNALRDWRFAIGRAQRVQAFNRTEACFPAALFMREE
jgi:hypothetical protein